MNKKENRLSIFDNIHLLKQNELKGIDIKF